MSLILPIPFGIIDSIFIGKIRIPASAVFSHQFFWSIFMRLEDFVFLVYKS